MGGFAVNISEAVPGQPLIYLTTAGTLRLVELGYKMPNIHQETIADKSKADPPGKIVLSIQAGYLIIQVIGRLIASLPVTILELNTLGHVLCAPTMYAFWFHKPLGICDPILLSDEWAQPLMLPWFMKDSEKRRMSWRSKWLSHGASAIPPTPDWW